MKFDMNAAWNDAMALIRGNREVLAVVAGVFILLPGLAMAVLFADQQAQAMGTLRSMLTAGPGLVPRAAAQPAPGWFYVVAVAMFVIEIVGYLSLLALLDSRQRPTVGEAILTALRCLLPMIGAILLFVVGYSVIGVALSLVAGLLVAGAAAASGSAGATAGLGFIFIIVLLAVIFWVMVRFSLTIADIVLGRTLNPVRALIQSWRMTKGNGGRLFGFYLLLFIAYLVITIVLFGVLYAVGAALPGQTGGLVLGIASGVIAAVFAVLVSALVAAIYRQLAGPNASDLSGTFE